MSDPGQSFADYKAAGRLWITLVSGVRKPTNPG